MRLANALKPILACILPGLLHANPWIKAEREGDFLYFFTTDSVEVFDLSTKSWRNAISLTQTPTAACVEGLNLYVAYGPTVMRMEADGHTFNLGAFSQEVSGLMVDNSYLIVSHAVSFYEGYVSWIDKQTGEVAHEYAVTIHNFNNSTFSLKAPTLSPVIWEIFGLFGSNQLAKTRYYPGWWVRTTVSDNTLGISDERPTVSNYVFPDGRLVLHSGGKILYTDDLALMGDLKVLLNDATFLGNRQIIALHENQVTGFSASLQPRGTIQLSQTAYDVERMGDEVIVFYEDATSPSGIGFEAHPLAQLGLQDPDTPLNPAEEAIGFDRWFVDRNGLFNIYSRNLNTLFRWDAASFRWADPVTLPVRSSQVGYDRAGHALIIGEGSQFVHRLDLDTQSTGGFQTGMIPRPQFKLFVADGFYGVLTFPGRDFLDTFHLPGGEPAQSGYLSNTQYGLYLFHDYVVDSNNRIFSGLGFTDDSLLSYQLHQDGTLTKLSGISGWAAPVRYRTGWPVHVVEEQNRLLTTRGHFFDTDSLELLGSLPTNVSAATTLDGYLFTLADNTDPADNEEPTVTILQKWDLTTLSLQQELLLPGTPYAVYAIDGFLNVVSRVEGKPVFSKLSSTLDLVASTAVNRDGGDFAEVERDLPLPKLTWDGSVFGEEDFLSIRFFDTRSGGWTEVATVDARRGYIVLDHPGLSGQLVQITRKEKHHRIALPIPLQNRYTYLMAWPQREETVETKGYLKLNESGPWTFWQNISFFNYANSQKFLFNDSNIPGNYLDIELRSEVMETSLVQESYVDVEEYLTLQWYVDGEADKYVLEIQDNNGTWQQHAEFSPTTSGTRFALGDLPLYAGNYRIIRHKGSNASSMPIAFIADVSIDWSRAPESPMGYILEMYAGYGNWFTYMEVDSLQKSYSDPDISFGRHYPRLRVSRIESRDVSIFDPGFERTITHELMPMETLPPDINLGLEWRDYRHPEWQYTGLIVWHQDQEFGYEPPHLREYRYVEVEIDPESVMGFAYLPLFEGVTNAATPFLETRIREGHIRVWHKAQPGCSSRIESSSNLRDWQIEKSRIPGTGLYEFSEIQYSPQGPARFFRIIEE